MLGAGCRGLTRIPFPAGSQVSKSTWEAREVSASKQMGGPPGTGFSTPLPSVSRKSCTCHRAIAMVTSDGRQGGSPPSLEGVKRRGTCAVRPPRKACPGTEALLREEAHDICPRGEPAREGSRERVEADDAAQCALPRQGHFVKDLSEEGKWLVAGGGHRSNQTFFLKEV